MIAERQGEHGDDQPRRSPTPSSRTSSPCRTRAILPANSPPKDVGTKPLPGTGAYTSRRTTRTSSSIMKRNPYFKQWSADAQPDGYVDEIDYSFGLTVEAQITQIENGQADWTLESPPADRLTELGTKYASQVHVDAADGVLVRADEHEPPAVQQPQGAAGRQLRDRPQRGRQDLRRPEAGDRRPARCCRRASPGTRTTARTRRTRARKWSAPDLAKAKELVKESGTAGQKVAVVSSDDEVNKAMGVYLQSVLNSIGYKATVKPISANIQFTYIQNTNNKVQISVPQWYQDYPAASDFLYVLFGCESFHPGSDSSINIAGFCNKKINSEMTTALHAASTDPAGEQAVGEDRPAVTDEAPMASLLQPAAHRLRLEAGRQLRVQQAVLLDRRPSRGSSRPGDRATPVRLRSPRAAGVGRRTARVVGRARGRWRAAACSAIASPSRCSASRRDRRPLPRAPVVRALTSRTRTRSSRTSTARRSSTASECR